jgi:hypothetical protein
MTICPRNAHYYGHKITDEKHADEWCQRMKGQHCEGCERNKATVKESLSVQKAEPRRLW